MQRISCKQWILSCCVCLLTACGGGGGGGGGGGATTDAPPAVVQWTSQVANTIDAGGLLSPHMQAGPDEDGLIHIAYFVGSDASTYDIRHLVWDPVSDSLDLDESALAQPIDNCGSLGFALDGSNAVLAYQGGEERLGGVEVQSDAMFSTNHGSAWQEYTGAIGFVERNPYFVDGFAGVDLTVAVDAQGGLHLAYQFHYEGIDAHNSAFPDINYVYYPGYDFDTSAIEETIEGNDYDGINGDENNVGGDCDLVIADNNTPAVFYYAELSDSDNSEKGLRMAARDGGIWTPEWVDRNSNGNSYSGLEVGAISAATAADGTLGVAYYVKEVFDDLSYAGHLRYAQKGPGEDAWQVAIVDESTIGGDYCSLAFDEDSKPAIAYYDSRSHSGYTRENLKLATRNGTSWDLENVLTTGNVGKYNSLWFTDGQPFVATYSETDKAIVLVGK